MMAAPASTWQKLTRRLGTDGNPLRRRTDVIQSLLFPVGLAIFVALSPLAFLVASVWVHADNAAVVHEQQSWHPVQAVLLRSAAGPQYPDRGANTWTVWTPARWTSDGREQVGEVPVPSRTTAGTALTVWLDRAGHVQTPPMTGAEVTDLVGTVTVLVLGGMALVLTGLGGLVVMALNRRRLADWERAWLAVGPRWSRQQRWPN